MGEDTKNLFEIGMNDIPDHLPLFPLDNVLLLPFGKLPLNIFEPRYIKMVLESLKKQRLIFTLKDSNVTIYLPKISS